MCVWASIKEIGSKEGYQHKEVLKYQGVKKGLDW